MKQLEKLQLKCVCDNYPCLSAGALSSLNCFLNYIFFSSPIQASGEVFTKPTQEIQSQLQPKRKKTSNTTEKMILTPDLFYFGLTRYLNILWLNRKATETRTSSLKCRILDPQGIPCCSLQTKQFLSNTVQVTEAVAKGLFLVSLVSSLQRQMLISWN